jgi:hypothetical protein
MRLRSGTPHAASSTTSPTRAPVLAAAPTRRRQPPPERASATRRAAAHTLRLPRRYWCWLSLISGWARASRRLPRAAADRAQRPDTSPAAHLRQHPTAPHQPAPAAPRPATSTRAAGARAPAAAGSSHCPIVILSYLVYTSFSHILFHDSISISLLNSDIE